MVWRAVLALCGLLATLPVNADSAYLQELIHRARQLKLANQPEWRALLHYKPRILGAGVESLNDDPAFFNAPDGRRNPDAELQATLAAFFVPASEDDRQQPAQCRFIARYYWLKEKLAFDAARLPEAPCRRFQAYRKALDPQGATLIFAAAFLNNPASMFGHTLLRIDRRGRDERTRLLSPTVNYSAHATDPIGLRYAWRGLTGGYHGRFTLAPYYLKVRDYNDLEHRDLWEYRLTLTPEEMQRLIRHLWELLPGYNEYYFFDENCSYHLLTLLEVARPGLTLTDGFRGWTIPSDTIHAVVRNQGLVDEILYRPSSATLLRDRMRRLTPDDRRLANDLGEGRQAPERLEQNDRTPVTQAAVLDAATALVKYRQEKQIIPAADGERLSSALLLVRSRVEAAGPPSPVPPPVTRPDLGHSSMRFGLGAGRERGRRFAELEWRAGYHDLLDPSPGFEPGAQIEVFRVSWRHRQDERTRVQEVRLLDVLSLPARDESVRPWAWRLQGGWMRKAIPGLGEPLVFHLNAGGGMTLGRQRSLPYLLVVAAVEADPRFTPDWIAGVGPVMGWVVEPVSGWRLHARAQRLHYSHGPAHDDREAILSVQVDRSRHHGWRLEGGRRTQFDQGSREWKLSWYGYY